MKKIQNPRRVLSSKSLATLAHPSSSAATKPSSSDYQGKKADEQVMNSGSPEPRDRTKPMHHSDVFQKMFKMVASQVLMLNTLSDFLN